MSHPDTQGTRSIADRIRSHRQKDGPYAVWSRIRKDAYIDALAAKIANTYPTTSLGVEDLRRVVLLQERLAPQEFWTTAEVSANLRTARHNEMKPIKAPDITPQLLKRMTAVERLNLVNGAGLPARIKLVEPGEDE